MRHLPGNGQCSLVRYDEDDIANGCDECPCFSSDWTLDDLFIITAGSNYWSRSPVILQVVGVQTDGRWMENEYTTHVRIPTEESEYDEGTADDDGLTLLD